MTYGNKEITSIMDAFKKGKVFMNDVEVEIVGGENELDPLTLLHTYEIDRPTPEDLVPVASALCSGKEIRFIRDNVILFNLVYTGGDLVSPFAKCPYYLDVLLKLAYGIVIKKLTPPSEDSKNEERQ